ncbi:myosin-binding protein 3-like isoform X2 [Phoenix dactylifera]|uniref:Myosin-binding protein 3-like isoform X2 n=1 Tax=Phoenix dactylifera TaxID=42345 RepID=A0A8B7BLI8_PHODC|nr:myosin-binding protein 3-like isoform X2 [Phoenix dactylifera]
MAANKFATMLHKNTNRMAVILVYTLLEWILIALLLLNGLFSYLIGKFADFFGLKAPCLFCSRVDHLFEPGRGRSAYDGLLCEAHAAEVSRLGYCSNHRRLAEASDMCEDCLSARPAEADQAVALLTWMKRSDEGEKDLRCSCCGVILESGFYSPYLLLKPSSWGVLDYPQKGNLVEEIAEDRERTDKDTIFDQERDKVTFFDQESVEEEKMALWDGGDTTDEREKKEDDMGALISEPEAEQEQEGEALIQFSETCLLDEDASLEVLTRRVEKVTDEERLFPLELIDSITTKSSILYKIDGEDDRELGNDAVEENARAFESRSIAEGKLALASAMEKADTVEMCSLPPAGEPGGDFLPDHQQCAVPQEITAPVSPQDSVDAEVEASVALEDSSGPQASEEDTELVGMEANCEIWRGSELCDQEHVDQAHFHELIPLSVSLEDQHSESYNEATATETGPVVTIAQSVERLSMSAELNEVEEERALETPTYIDGIHGLHKRFVFERREFGTESVDGSVASEIEGSEPLTIDRLKSALKAERKALSALYAELEEERSASAIAANQTMAMITRLQGERAAMQMEALQYQRMMEEQSEYDQEALQLLNELMMKREKEKQDLEKELEVYRKKVLLYEAKERRRLVRSNYTSVRSGTSSASSSAEDSDDLSFDFHEGDECTYRLNESNQNTPTDAIFSSGTDQDTAKHLITLDETLVYFEEERLSILDQLKALEEKLFSLDDEVSDNVKAMEHFSEENGHAPNGNYESLGDEAHDVLNGFSDDLDTKDKHHCEQRSTGCRRKRLLPLFDAANVENEGELCTRQEVTDASTDSMSKLPKEQMKLAIAEEVDNVYERLQALEADREFLKHCISSLKKGDKGMDLLQEILQHLRDLRSVELRVKNADDALALL